VGETKEDELKTKMVRVDKYVGVVSLLREAAGLKPRDGERAIIVQDIEKYEKLIKSLE
jgi:hypothetical protein